MTLTASRRFDKCPTPGHRCSEKFPSTGTDKMANARQMSGGIFFFWGGGGWARLEFTCTESQKLLKNISEKLLCCKKKSQSGVRKLNHKQEP